jgi:hypothetical protein
MTDYTKQAQMLAKQYARNFHGPSYSLDDGEATFNLNEASEMIRQAKIEKAQILRQIESQRGPQEILDQQREDVSLLPDREAERIQAEWAEAAKAQAEHYAIARNKKGTTPRSTQGVDPSITSSVLSWIKKQRLYNKKN